MISKLLTEFPLWFLSRSQATKRMMTLAVDFIAAVGALWFSFSLWWGGFYVPTLGQSWIFLLAPVVAIPVFIKFGLYRSIIRYIGPQALMTILQATLMYAVLFSLIVLLVNVSGIPKAIYALNGFLMLIFVAGSRLLARWWFHRANGGFRATNRQGGLPVLIYGAGEAGAQLASILRMGHELNPVGFIDDNQVLHQQQVNDLNVYPFERLTYLMGKYAVYDVLLAMPAESHRKRQEIISRLEPYPVHVRTLPDLMDIAHGRIQVKDIQEVAVADLLGRDTVAPDQNLLHRNVTNKSVMVTGAGGSIGSELCRQIMRLSPETLVLFELNEYALYAIEKELQQAAIQVYAVMPKVVAVLGSVNDQARFEKLCRRLEVETIYHAAAYKHVPMAEKNIGETIRNNIFGTLHCAQAAVSAGVETFVLISTDKAVRPTNIMGATKRFAELILQAIAGDTKQAGNTRFTMVRFGNVLDSSGSVVPLFREQIARGGPVTVTDPEVTRYFMTIPEAAELVIQAGAMGQGGDVFVLDMGESVQIVDLARRMIRLSGFEVKTAKHPQGDIEINYTGLRSGEKLYEELLIGSNVSDTQHLKIRRAEEDIIPWQRLDSILEELGQANENDDCEVVRALLVKHVAGFQPQADIEDIMWQPPLKLASIPSVAKIYSDASAVTDVKTVESGSDNT